MIKGSIDQKKKKNPWIPVCSPNNPHDLGPPLCTLRLEGLKLPTQQRRRGMVSDHKGIQAGIENGNIKTP